MPTGFIPAVNGFGSVLKLATAESGAAMKTIAYITQITGPAFSRGMIDVSNHGTTDFYEQVIPNGIIRSSPIGFTGLYISSEANLYNVIPGLLDAGVTMEYFISIADLTTQCSWKGAGVVTGYTVTAPAEGPAMFTMTIKPSGKPTFGDGTT